MFSDSNNKKLASKAIIGRMSMLLIMIIANSSLIRALFRTENCTLTFYDSNPAERLEIRSSYFADYVSAARVSSNSSNHMVIIENK